MVEAIIDSGDSTLLNLGGQRHDLFTTFKFMISKLLVTATGVLQVRNRAAPPSHILNFKFNLNEIASRAPQELNHHDDAPAIRPGAHHAFKLS